MQKKIILTEEVTIGSESFEVTVTLGATFVYQPQEDSTGLSEDVLVSSFGVVEVVAEWDNLQCEIMKGSDMLLALCGFNAEEMVNDYLVGYYSDILGEIKAHD